MSSAITLIAVLSFFLLFFLALIILGFKKGQSIIPIPTTEISTIEKPISTEETPTPVAPAPVAPTVNILQKMPWKEIKQIAGIVILMIVAFSLLFIVAFYPSLK